jgi:zinc/manganese transport system substrate-binding protein
VALVLVGLLAGRATGVLPSNGPAVQLRGSSASSDNTKIAVVAAENFWGSIAAQVGGEHVSVHSVITNPDADPHSYEPTAADARALAGAQFVIANGVGYDPWVTKLLDANPEPRRVMLTVGDLIGAKEGSNPHLWYSPDDVQQVINQIAADYTRIDPSEAHYFDHQRQVYETQGLARYHQLIADIRNKYGGTPIGASESIVTPLAKALGLKMETPESFLDAVSEGTEPSAADKITVDRQIKTKQIKTFVFNTQNSTPDVAALVAEAKANGIPVATVTETLAPATATFQQWQVHQLVGIERALAQSALPQRTLSQVTTR